MALKVGILGNGSWATALVKMLTDNQHAIHWWMRNENAVNHLKTRGHNKDYLSSVSFDTSLLSPSTDIKQIIASSDIILIAIPSAYLDELLNKLPADIFLDKTIISAVKGIIPYHYNLLNNYLKEHFNFPFENYISISGPCHAEEVALERLSYLTFSGKQVETTASIAKMFETEYLKVSTNQDIFGTQYAGVLKNIYAIGAGMAYALGYGDNFLSVFITNCYRESLDLLVAQFEEDAMKDCDIPDVHTSAYLGDLLVTCYSPHSRNRQFGLLVGKGYSIAAAIAEMSMVAEGYHAAKGMREIGKKLEVNMPIAEKIFEVLWNGLSAREAFKSIEQILD